MEEKLKALLKGLECVNIEEFIKKATREQYTQFGNAYITAVRNVNKEKCIKFLDWLMTNCELTEDQSLWSYQGEDYSLEGIYDLFIKE